MSDDPIREHAPIPALCDECLVALLDDVLADPELTPNGYYCPHRQVFAVVTVERGRIASWSLSGPIAEQAVRQTLDQNVHQNLMAAEALRRVRPYGTG
jgi:hypothetical protein